MSEGKVTFTRPTRTWFNIRIPSLGIIYGCVATGHFKLNLPPRYEDLVKIDGRYKQPLCTVRVGSREKTVTLKKLTSGRGFRVWAWREVSIKRAFSQIETEIRSARKEWQNERMSQVGAIDGRAVV